MKVIYLRLQGSNINPRLAMRGCHLSEVWKDPFKWRGVPADLIPHGSRDKQTG